ncbi:Uncharacterised protein [Campylobacter sputorum subsp. bubulus]|uniref:Uncharacterized protein n=1 Tax=Campylobacter sputorum subsp. sputorum TaxID=32024 RepID=A0A381DJI1_9BACT|nr:hypothetical protein [Campylobacter sputorum]ASM35835.1 hypothetical protein CSPUT_1676 [Campylobacter sputorum aubsp. sputorum RM3237]KAB0581548.1 hypothetical protein F7P64_06425 [Campylobacter sputorum subsp. sputorum]QEL06025.1 hypothetical protein CSPT_1671 [Campylobacter sputorum subsp. sputorum]SUX09135.1 Uncharacterised protein [Campylobacter sputorum subsp. bubulus]SUX10826.1 Uncharacterised protein [Campylobacter sputorum subsp. sputorum]
MKNESYESQFIVHYYLNDNSHSINTLVRNSIEKDFLSIINVISSALNIEIKLESRVPEKGGFIEVLDIIESHPVASTLLTYTVDKIIRLIKYILSGEYKKGKLELKKLELEISKLQNENAEKIDNNKLEQKVARPLSNYYTKIEKYEKIEAVGFGETKNDEFVVKRTEFRNFILTDGKEIEIDEEASIELISPVLKEGKHKWRGIYNGENIDFSMGDSKFKNDVIDGRYDFGNGSFIICELNITKTYDDFGNESKNRTYRVSKVYETKRDTLSDWEFTHKGIVKKRNKIKNSYKTPSLFSDDDFKEQE